MQVFDLYLADQPAGPSIFPSLALQPGAHVSVHPYGTKTTKSAHAGAIKITMLAEDLSSLCPVRWLAFMAATAFEAGSPVTTYLFRTFNRKAKTFNSVSLDSNALAQAFVKKLKQYGLYKGQSLHSLRRGSMQHAVYEDHQTRHVVAEAALIRTPAVAERYLDQTRHLKRGRHT